MKVFQNPLQVVACQIPIRGCGNPINAKYSYDTYNSLPRRDAKSLLICLGSARGSGDARRVFSSRLSVRYSPRDVDFQLSSSQPGSFFFPPPYRTPTAILFNLARITIKYVEQSCRLTCKFLAPSLPRPKLPPIFPYPRSSVPSSF